MLISEIKKIEFSYMQIYVYKSITKKEKILTTKLKTTDLWEENLCEILDTNVFTNVKIILFYAKKEI